MTKSSFIPGKSSGIQITAPESDSPAARPATRDVKLQFSSANDNDVLGKLNTVADPTDYVRQLIRLDLKQKLL